jgi:hypothetical protein
MKRYASIENKMEKVPCQPSIWWIGRNVYDADNSNNDANAGENCETCKNAEKGISAKIRRWESEAHVANDPCPMRNALEGVRFSFASLWMARLSPMAMPSGRLTLNRKAIKGRFAASRNVIFLGDLSESSGEAHRDSK